MKFIRAKRPLEFRAGDHFANESIGIKQHVVVEKNIVNADNTVAMEVDLRGRPEVRVTACEPAVASLLAGAGVVGIRRVVAVDRFQVFQFSHDVLPLFRRGRRGRVRCRALPERPSTTSAAP